MRGCAAALGGATRVHDPDVFAGGDLWEMGVAVGDDVTARERGAQPLVPSVTRARVVNEAEAKALGLDDPLGGKRPAKRGLVHVPVDGLDGAVLTQLLEHGGGGEVADMKDQLRRIEKAETVVGKSSPAVRQVRVADERDQKRPSRNRPFRYTSSPSA